MIQREDILSIDYLKKSEYTGSHQGMRYRLEGIEREEGKLLQVSVWPEPFNYLKTSPEKIQSIQFVFSEEGIMEAVDWMNERLIQDRDKWDHSWDNWSEYTLE